MTKPRRNPFILTTWWVIFAAGLCVLRPTGTLKPGIIVFVLTPLPLIFEIMRRKFKMALNKPHAPKSGGS